jgi:hypothetical protein
MGASGIKPNKDDALPETELFKEWWISLAKYALV